MCMLRYLICSVESPWVWVLTYGTVHLWCCVCESVCMVRVCPSLRVCVYGVCLSAFMCVCQQV